VTSFQLQGPAGHLQLHTIWSPHHGVDGLRMKHSPRIFTMRFSHRLSRDEAVLAKVETRAAGGGLLDGGGIRERTPQNVRSTHTHVHTRKNKGAWPRASQRFTCSVSETQLEQLRQPPQGSNSAAKEISANLWESARGKYLGERQPFEQPFWHQSRTHRSSCRASLFLSFCQEMSENPQHTHMLS
jgi:hypothetical protein